MAPITLADARIIGPLLVLLTYFPKRFNHLVPPRLRPLLKSSLLKKLLLAIAGYDVLRKTNKAVSQYFSNNCRSIVFRSNSELVLITGGCSGIGLLMAKEFAKRGVKVIILDLREPKESVPVNVHFYKCDVTSTAEIADTAISIRKDHGDPTVLINNAGIATLNSIFGGTEKSIRDTFEVNTISHFWMVREFVPAMVRKNHGHVVTIASMASYVVHALNVDYCCTKASALVFHEGLSSELKNIYDAPNIRTTTINPAWIRTPLIEEFVHSKHWKAPFMEPDFVVQKIVNQVMAGQGGQIILPPTTKMNFFSTIRSWPLWAQLYVRNGIGKEFKALRASLDEAA
ncbi:putative short-chain dehydrogenase reductase [Erysiphe necator]|uniref:Short-chain dehydrogenase/reductase 3 n=1 Tax=Uncinula necator TaxID=52586 RepID=A0A0B1PB76_UNCNE|nr:putative short-chain dehydrogenase reductase [Erysiphe necator]